MKGILLWSGFIVLGVVIAGAAFAAIRIGPANIIGLIRYDQREEGSLRVGDRLPDVKLISLNGAADTRVHDLIGEKPLVLIFGSFT